jgi:hypothetical protein
MGELLEEIQKIRNAYISQLSINATLSLDDLVTWEHYFAELEKAVTLVNIDSNFHVHLYFTQEGKSSGYNRYLSANDIIIMRRAMKKIGKLITKMNLSSETVEIGFKILTYEPNLEVVTQN